MYMETGDTRYLHLNTGMWIGSGVRRGTESEYCIQPPTKAEANALYSHL